MFGNSAGNNRTYDIIETNMPKRLTTKQKMFVAEYVKTKGHGQKAALRVYDTKDKHVAEQIAYKNLKQPTVQQELKRALERSNLSIDKITEKLKDVVSAEPVKGYTGSDIMQAINTGLKLHGVLTDKKTITNYNMNMNLQDLSVVELQELRSKKNKEVDIVIAS